MAGSIIALNNRLDGATVTATGTATGSAVANLYAYRPSKTWTAAATTAGQRVNVDTGTASTNSYLALHNHNLPAAGTYKIQSHTVAPPASGAWSGATERGTITYRAADMFISFGSASVRYWSLYLEDSDGAAGAFAAAPKIGELVLTDGAQLSRPFSHGGNRTIGQRTIRHETPGGNQWSAHIAEIRGYVVTYEDQSDSDLALLQALNRGSSGAGKPVSIALDPDHPTAAKAAEVEYVMVSDAFSWVDDLNHSNISFTYTTLPVEISLT